MINLYKKPIISSYVDFNSRNIIYEDIFGRRSLKLVVRSYGVPFPLEWTCKLNNKEIKQILEKKESEELMVYLKISKESFVKTNLSM